MYNLIIKEVKAEDAATYQAEFTNRAGEKKVQVPLIVHCKYFYPLLLRPRHGQRPGPGAAHARVQMGGGRLRQVGRRWAEQLELSTMVREVFTVPEEGPS